jgi:uncharacterized membrane protein YeaQ/YmgE (transglycosylase-associated protein family)
MARYRISLAGSLGIVAVIAMGLAGMRLASSLWTTAAATITLALLLSAVIAARLLDGLDRAFWGGFALFGWSYLLLVNWDWIGGQFGHDLTAGLSDVAEAMFAKVDVPAPPQPPATPLTARTPPNLPLPPGQGAANPPPATGFVVVSHDEYLEQARARQIKLGNFVQIGRMLLALIFGLMGGLIARAIAHARATTPQDAATPATTGRAPG